MRFIGVRGWEKHQHYKDRHPPWIKLYRSLHEKWEWLTLPDHTKAHLVGLWLLVAEVGNRLPWDKQFLSNKIGATIPVTDEELQLLVDREFLALLSAPAPALLAEAEQPASKLLAKPGQTIKRTEYREQKLPPLTPPSGGAPASLAKATARQAVDRLVASRAAVSEMTPRRTRRWLYEQLQAGRTEADLQAEWEAERERDRIAIAQEKAIRDRVTAEEKANLERATLRRREAEDWIERHGGAAVVSRSILDWRQRSGSTQLSSALLGAWAREDPSIPRDVPALLYSALGDAEQQAKSQALAQPRSRPP